MWGHLRTAVVYFMRYQEGQHQPEHIDAAQDALFQYSVLVQEHFDTNHLMTFQLHTCMAHVAEQARLCGPTAFAAEWWLERCMQVFKRITKYRSTRHPECVGTNHFLAVQALDKIASCCPQSTALLDKIDPPAGRTRKGARDDTAGDEWLAGPIQDVSDDHLAVRTIHPLHFDPQTPCTTNTVYMPIVALQRARPWLCTWSSSCRSHGSSRHCRPQA